jgi:hypothetical protein
VQLKGPVVSRVVPRANHCPRGTQARHGAVDVTWGRRELYDRTVDGTANLLRRCPGRPIRLLPKPHLGGLAVSSTSDVETVIPFVKSSLCPSK